MKLEYLVAVAVRLFSIALLIYVLRNFVNVISIVTDTNLGILPIAYLGTFVAIILIAILLWNFPLIIAHKITGFPSMEESNIETPEFEELLSIGLILLGLYLLFYVISDLLYWGIAWLALQRDTSSDLSFNFDQKIAISITFIELVFAAYLILGNRTITKLIRGIRYAGRN